MISRLFRVGWICACCLIAVPGCQNKKQQSQEVDSLAVKGEVVPASQSGAAAHDPQNTLWKALNGPFADDVLSVLTLSNGRILAGTTRGLFVSTDRGTGWVESYHPDLSVKSLRRDKAGTIVGVVGSGLYRAVASSDEGTTWRTLQVRSDSVWSRIFVSESGSLLFKDKSDSMYHTSDLGTTWSNVKVPGGAGKIYAIGFERDGQAITVTDKKKILISKDDGRSWTAIGTEYPYVIQTIHILDNGEFFVIMGSGWTYKSADRGKSWTEKRDTDFGELFVNLSGGHLLAMSKSKGLMESRDHGNSWSSLGPPFATITSVAFDMDSSLIASTYSRGVFRLERTDGQWVQMTSGWSPANVECVAFGSRGTLYAGANGVYRSDDDGNSWKNITLSFSDLHITSIVVDTHDRMYTTSWTGFIMTSSNRGETWDCLNPGGMGYGRIRAMCLALDSSGSAYVGCMDEGVMRLSLAEKRLLPISQSYERVEQLYYDAHTNSFLCVMVDFVSAGEDLHSGHDRVGTLHRSVDSCRTWKPLLEGEHSVECVAIDPLGSLIVGTDSSGVIRSTDHGETWRSIGLNHVEIISVAAYGTSSILAATYDTVYATTDGGKSWKLVYSVARSAPERSAMVNFVSLSPQSYLYLGGWQIGLLKSVLALPELLR